MKTIIKTLLIGSSLLSFSTTVNAQGFNTNNQNAGQFSTFVPQTSSEQYGMPAPQKISINENLHKQRIKNDISSAKNSYEERIEKFNRNYDKQFGWYVTSSIDGERIEGNHDKNDSGYDNKLKHAGNINSKGQIVSYGKGNFQSSNTPNYPLSIKNSGAAPYSIHSPYGNTPMVYIPYPIGGNMPAPAYYGGYHPQISDGVNNRIIANTFSEFSMEKSDEELFEEEKENIKIAIEHGEQPNLFDVKQSIDPDTSKAQTNAEFFKGENGIYVGDERPSQVDKNDEDTVDIEEEKPDLVKRRRMANELLENGSPHDAILAFQSLLSDYPNDVESLLGVANAYYQNQQYKSSRDVYIKLLSIDPGNEGAMNNLIALIGEQHPSSALQQLFELERANPEYHPIPAQIATIYIHNNELEEAAKSLRRAISLSPKNISYFNALAGVYEHLGYNEEALTIYLEVLDMVKRRGAHYDGIDFVKERIYIISQQLGVKV